MRVRHGVSVRMLVLLATFVSVANGMRAQDPPPSPKGAPITALQANAARASSDKNQDFLISPDDVLDVYIVDVAEMSRKYRVTPSGTIDVPLLKKPLLAAGLTLNQLSDLISDELRGAGLVSDPQVTVTVEQSRLHSVAITGAVKHPQIYSVFSRTTLLDVLSQAEGLTDEAGNVAIVRRGDIALRALGLDQQADANPAHDNALTLTVDIRRAMESGDLAANIDIYPGDRVTVPRAGIVYVVGAVNKPGGFTMRPSRQGMTVLQAVALAEDLKGTALRDQATIIRLDAQSPDGRQQIPVNLKKVLAGKAPDPILQAEDILFVPDSSSRKALRRGLEAVLQTATGVAIYRR